jgi:hypothetical protein
VSDYPDDPSTWDDETLQRWWEERRQRKQAHLATLDPETISLSRACINRVRDAYSQDRSIIEMRVPVNEYNAYEASLLPTERYTNTAHSAAGIDNLYCQGVVIIPQV